MLPWSSVVDLYMATNGFGMVQCTYYHCGAPLQGAMSLSYFLPAFHCLPSIAVMLLQCFRATKWKCECYEDHLGLCRHFIMLHLQRSSYISVVSFGGFNVKCSWQLGHKPKVQYFMSAMFVSWRLLKVDFFELLCITLCQYLCCGCEVTLHYCWREYWFHVINKKLFYLRLALYLCVAKV